MLLWHFGQHAEWRRGTFRFKMPIKLLDSTFITLTLSIYDWAHCTTKKGAVKMHTLLDYDSLLPELVNITDGKGADNKASFDMVVQPFSVVVADRGYCDYALLNLGTATMCSLSCGTRTISVMSGLKNVTCLKNECKTC